MQRNAFIERKFSGKVDYDCTAGYDWSMKSQLLANAIDIVSWANRRDAQGNFPQLIRRLVHASAIRVLRAGFRAGEGVSLGGWDGIVEVETGNAFVPDGLSSWELSTEKSVGAKANEDYDKRTNKPLGIEISQSSFVFVTARRWSKKDAWVAEKKKESLWRDVRAYDADNLEEWLESVSAIHLWFSVRLNKHPGGAEDIERYWEGWSVATRPPMSAELVTSGRGDIVKRIQDWLLNPASALTIQGDSRVEALAVVVASIQKLPPETRGSILAQTIIIHDPDAWKHVLTASKSRLILVMNFSGDETAIGRGLVAAHPSIVLLGRADSTSANTLRIPRIDSEEAAKALAAMGVAPEKVDSLADLARSSLASLRRKIAIAPELEQPKWARPENARSLLPALLAGRWSSKVEGDQEFIERLARDNYDRVSEQYVRWANEDDPPVRCTGTTWYLNSEEDAWSLLGRFLTRDDLERFGEAAIELLKVPDPSLELSDERRWMAGILNPGRKHSPILRAGIANTSAMMGASGGSIRTTDDVNVGDYARYCVRRVLKDNDWKIWASLPLTVLAEAAPDEFLSAVDRGLAGDSPVLGHLFRDKDDNMFVSPSHTPLLFALETVAWSPDYLNRSAIALARLARIDPGGNWANRPAASLRAVFLLWLPQTKASLEQRLTTIDRIRIAVPDIAWKLMRSLLPKGSDVQHPTARPRWREWAPDQDARVSNAEYGSAIRELAQRMLEDAGKNGTRWSDLVGALNYLPRDEYELVLTKLESIDPRDLQPADSADIWDALRSFVSQHRSHPDAKWSLPSTEIERLAKLLIVFEPQETLRRFGWLFGPRPMLPEGRKGDWQEYERAIATRQSEAVQTMFASEGLNGLEAMFNVVELPERIGSAIARSDIADKVEDDLLDKYLKSGQPRSLSFIGSLIHSKVFVAGFDWAKVKLARLGSKWTPSQQAAFCSCLPFNSGTWTILNGLSSVVRQEYWKTVERAYVEEAELVAAVQSLLQHDRASLAIQLLGLHVDRKKVAASLVLEALEKYCEVNQAENQRLSAHDVSDLLEYVSSSAEVDQARLAKLEWDFLPALGRHAYNPRVLHSELAKSPKFFAEVVALAYRAEGEPRHELSEEEQARAERAYELLDSWRFRPLPGMPDDGTLDPNAMRDWVLESREILCKNGRFAVGDHAIGQILSGSPGGKDGAWPHEAIRDLIEELSSDDFEQGIYIALLNSGGVYSRGHKEGGKREHEAAAKYEKWASLITGSWGRTGALLRSISNHYLSWARQEDQRAEIREDLLD